MQIMQSASHNGAVAAPPLQARDYADRWFIPIEQLLYINFPFEYRFHLTKMIKIRWLSSPDDPSKFSTNSKFLLQFLAEYLVLHCCLTWLDSAWLVGSPRLVPFDLNKRFLSAAAKPTLGSRRDRRPRVQARQASGTFRPKGPNDIGIPLSAATFKAAAGSQRQAAHWLSRQQNTGWLLLRLEKFLSKHKRGRHGWISLENF